MDHEDYIEALAGRRSEQRERAFSAAEYDARLARIRAAMDAAKLDALLVTEPANLCYLTGYTTFEVSVHACLVVPRAGALTLQVASIEVAAASLTTAVESIVGYSWERPEQIGRQLVERLDALGSAAGRIGVEAKLPGLRPGLCDEVAAALPRARLEDASSLVRGVRAIKSDAELACLREAANVTGAGMEAALGAVAPGRRDNDVAAAAYDGMVRAGGEFPCMPAIVSSGRRIGWIHTCFQRTPLETGDAVFIELGGCHSRYTSPQMRTAHIGEPTPAIERLAASAQDTVARLLEGARPGRTAHEVARDAARGFAPVEREAFFSGVYGYAVGVQFPPSWVEGSVFIAEGIERELEPGMVFHLPICYRIPAETGVGISETIAITADGCEPLTSGARGLRVVL